VDLEVERTIEGFSSLSGIAPEEMKKICFSHPVFLDFERGAIDSAKFREEVRATFNVPDATDESIDLAWNAMLAGLPAGKLALLQKLKERFQVFILSNTNSIHADYLHRISIPAASSHTSFEPFVHKVYYSHEIGMRKPDESIYRHVLNENNLNPSETLFLDDNLHNIEAAKKIGIQTIHILHPDHVTEALSSL
jgi:FMN phosphatase YigB (HAD superfamily)